MSDKKLNICLVSPDIYKAEMPARPAVTEIYGKYLPSFGHTVRWVCPSYDKQPETVKMNGVDVHLVPYSSHASLFGKAINFVGFYLRQYKKLVELYTTEKYDVIQVRNDVFAGLVALLLKRKYGILFVFQYSFPKESYKLKKIKSFPARMVGKIKASLQSYILKKADYIFVISKWMAAELAGRGYPMSKMMPLPMGVNPERFDFQADSLKIRKQLQLFDDTVILYFGEMSKERSLEVIIQAFKQVHNVYNNSKLLMVGDGNDRSHLESLSSESGLSDNIIFTGNVSYFEVPYYISSADVCLSPISPIDIHKVSSPTKLFESMVMRKPVVANNEIPEQKEIIEECECGVLVDFTPDSFANGIIELLTNPEKAKTMGENGYKWAVENRTYEQMAHQVENKYLGLLGF